MQHENTIKISRHAVTNITDPVALAIHCYAVANEGDPIDSAELRSHFAIGERRFSKAIDYLKNRYYR